MNDIQKDTNGTFRTDKTLQFLSRIKLAEEVKQRINKAILAEEFKDTTVEEVVFGYFEDQYLSANESILQNLSKYKD